MGDPGILPAIRQINVNDLLKQAYIGDFVKSIIGPYAEEVGLTLGDHKRKKRFDNELNMLISAKKKCEQAGISPKAINLKVLVPLLGFASLEDDSDLTERWAGLLATASGAGLKSHGYPHILSQLNSTEAKILDLIYESLEKDGSSENKMHLIGVPIEQTSTIFNLSKEDTKIHLDNLYRLRLCQPTATEGIKFGDNAVALATYALTSISPLGKDFVLACRGPKMAEQG